MKVTINGVEIDIIGGSRLTYDAVADTLSVDPITQEKRKYTKKTDKEKSLKKVGKMENIEEFDEDSFQSQSTTDLKTKIIEVILSGDQPMAQQFITLNCLGKGATSSARHYFSALLNQMGEDGELVLDNSSSRARWSIP